MYTSFRIKQIIFLIWKTDFPYEALVVQVAEACNCKCIVVVPTLGNEYTIFDISFPHFGNKAKWGMQCFKNLMDHSVPH